MARKVLGPALAMTLGSERFLREVTIAADLQHPQILPPFVRSPPQALLAAHVTEAPVVVTGGGGRSRRRWRRW